VCAEIVKQKVSTGQHVRKNFTLKLSAAVTLFAHIVYLKQESSSVVHFVTVLIIATGNARNWTGACATKLSADPIKKDSKIEILAEVRTDRGYGHYSNVYQKFNTF
jgi:hypothetical protein